MSTIALCIPAYNAAWCLPRLLKSARNQQIPFDEILVYDDCSTDNTAEIATQYGAAVISGLKNMGCSFGKNKLAEIAQSEWLHFHDADDDLLPNFISIAHEWFKKIDNPDIILLNFYYRDFNTGAHLGSPNYNRSKLISDTKKFVIENKIVNFAICKREIFNQIGGFDLDPNVLFNEDRAFYLRAATAGLKFDYEPRITSINFRYSDSMSSSNQIECVKAYLHVSKKAIQYFGDKYYKEIANGLWDNATIAASYADWDLVKENIETAVKINGNKPIGQSRFIKTFAMINPFFGYWLREKLIRVFKPHLRVNG